MKVKLNDKQKVLHERAVYLHLHHQKLEYARVENLIEIEASGVHKAFRKKMFIYATEVVGMDSGIAYPYIAVARASVQFPKLRHVLKTKRLTVPKAGRIVSILNKENAEELIEFALNHSKREIEDEVVKRNPKARTKGSIRAQSEEHDVFKVSISKTVTKNLRRVQSLNPLKDWSEILEDMVEVYLDHKDPVRKAERAEKRAAKSRATEQKSEKSGSDQSKVGPKSERPAKNYARAEKAKRVDLNAEQTHAANYRDRGCCTFIDAEGKRCNSDRWVEMHHLVRVADGGSNDPSNLTTLCAFHHDLTHQLSLPIDGQITWLR